MKYKISRVRQFSANDWSYLGMSSCEYDDIDHFLNFCYFYLVELHGEHFLHVKEYRSNVTAGCNVIHHWRIYVSDWHCIASLTGRLLALNNVGEKVTAQKVIRIFKSFENVSE